MRKLLFLFLGHHLHLWFNLVLNMESLPSSFFRTVQVNFFNFLTLMNPIFLLDLKHTKVGILGKGFVNRHHLFSSSIVINILIFITSVLEVHIHISIQTNSERFLTWGGILRIIETDPEGFITGLPHIVCSSSFSKSIEIILIFSFNFSYLFAGDMFCFNIFFILDLFLLTWVDMKHIFTSNFFFDSKNGFFMTNFFLLFWEFFLQMWFFGLFRMLDVRLFMLFTWVEQTINWKFVFNSFLKIHMNWR